MEALETNLGKFFTNEFSIKQLYKHNSVNYPCNWYIFKHISSSYIIV